MCPSSSDYASVAEAPPSAPPAALDLSALDGLRGLAAVVVVVGHILTFFTPVASPWTQYGVPPPPTGASPAPPAFSHDARWPLFGLEYHSAVTLFFVISGFTLVHVYEKPVAPGAPLPLSTRAQRSLFFRKRVARLAPVYYAGLLLGVVPFVVTFAGDPLALGIGFPISLLGLQSLFLFKCQNWDGPLWTVSAFVVCYLCFPSLLCRMRHYSYARLRWLVFAMTGVSALLAGVFLGTSGMSLAWVLHFFAPFRLPHFITGVASGLMAQRRPPQRAALSAELCSALLAANLAFCAALTAVVVPRVSGYIWLLYSNWIEFLLPGIHGIWLAALAAPPAPPGARCCGGHVGPSRALLSSAPLRRLGDVSYALYCLHFPTLQWAVYAIRARGVSWSAAPLMVPNDVITGWFALPGYAIAPLLAICLAVAALAHVALERPARSAIVKRAADGDAVATATLLPVAAPQHEANRPKSNAFFNWAAVMFGGL